MIKYMIGIGALCFMNLQTNAQITKSIKYELNSYVNPFIGTGGHGHTYPGASAPFGMMQLSPDTRYEGWDGCSGYHYSDSIIYGFSHTHLSGTGVPDYNDLLVVPQMGKSNTTPGYKSPAGYGASFKHINEKASPGFYEVTFDNKINVKLATTERCGMHYYTFPNTNEQKFILLDLDHRDKLILAEFDIINNHTVEGTRLSQAWASEQHFYFSLQSSVDFTRSELIKVNGQHKLLLTFPATTKEIKLKVGMSAVDKLGARTNLEEEIPHWDFNKVKNETSAKWEAELGKIVVTTSNKEQKINFYTALYHSFLNPNIFNDVTGKYRGRDNKIHQLEKGKTQYTVFSLWDTYRGAHPLFTLLQQARTKDFIETFQRQFDEGGDLPVWELAGNETECMIGYHSVSVIADAYFKDVPGINIQGLIQAMIATSNFDELGKKSFNENGFIGVDDEPESVSKTLEYAYDSYCIYQALKKAKSEGHKIDEELLNTFLNRSFHFINVFDPATGFMRGRRGGMWFSPFKPEEVNFNYTEANSWQYSLYAPHAIQTLIDLHGGRNGLEKYLDDLFTTESHLSGRHQVDITGLIGQYAHGNEPSHHMAYLYNYTNQHFKTQQIVDSILNHQYWNAPDGLSGNEDCGQMSAWYVLSSIGFYPVSPGSGKYDIGRPLFDKVVIQLENDKQLTFNYLNNERNHKYIHSIQHNNTAYSHSFIDHSDLEKGGTWDFEMSSKPNRTLNLSPNLDENLLPSSFIPAPYFTATERVFDESCTVEIKQPLENPDFVLYYTLDGSNPIQSGKIYQNEIEITTTSNLKAVVKNIQTNEFGTVISNEFVQKEKGIHIELFSEYDNQYAAGGKTTLIDGIKGADEYRTGDWQGYYAQDVRAKVSFDDGKQIQTVGLNCLQDTKSWIFLPKMVEITIHYLDGTSELKKVPLAEQTKEQLTQKHILLFQVDVANKKVKSIEINAVNYGKCPDWHLGAGHDTWIFVDEIVFN